MFSTHAVRLAGSTLAAAILVGSPAVAEPLALNDPAGFGGSIFQQVMPQQPLQDERGVVAESGPADSAVVPERLKRQVVAYDTREPAGTIIIDTPHTYL